MNALLSNPPTANFFAGSSLKVSAAPISKMLLIDDTGMEEEPSTAYKQAYSSPSESSTSAIVCSPSTSRKALGREVSREAIASFKSRNSISSDYVPSPVNLVPGVIPKKDFTSGGSVLFTVPEGHASSGKVYSGVGTGHGPLFTICHGGRASIQYIRSPLIRNTSRSHNRDGHYSEKLQRTI